MSFLEIACFSPLSAHHASQAGAHRIEFCSSLSVGGLTPSLSQFKSLKAEISIPIFVMIRPHGTSFVYTTEEISRTGDEIERFLDAGAEGFVFGVLDANGMVDEIACRDLLSKAKGRPCTFHRAFDEIPRGRMEEALEVLVKCGFANVLTSGGGKYAMDGREVLKKLVERAKGRIEIIVGGGVRSKNFVGLREMVTARWWHSSAVVDDTEVASCDEMRVLRAMLDDGDFNF